jgi:hypothetical protein
VFQDGSIKAITPASKACYVRRTSKPDNIQSRWVPQSQSLYTSPDYNTSREMPHFQTPFPMIKTDADLSKRKYTQPRSGGFLKNITDFKRFPFNNFTYCLTLFSKFFSSFPHGTCALSVSRQYLALDGIYHPFRAAFPNNSTLWKCITNNQQPVPKTGLSPSMMLCSKKLLHRVSMDNTSLIYNSDSQHCQILNLSSSLFTRSY